MGKLEQHNHPENVSDLHTSDFNIRKHSESFKKELLKTMEFEKGKVIDINTRREITENFKEPKTIFEINGHEITDTRTENNETPSFDPSKDIKIKGHEIIDLRTSTKAT